MLQASMTPKEKQYYSEILYIDYMSSKESDYEEQEDFITGEKEKKLARYVTKKLSWERTSLTNAKARLDRTYKNNLTPHARAMAKPRSVGGMSESANNFVFQRFYFNIRTAGGQWTFVKLRVSL